MSASTSANLGEGTHNPPMEQTSVHPLPDRGSQHLHCILCRPLVLLYLDASAADRYMHALLQHAGT